MKFIGELLIFVLLFITNLRVFFVNSPKRDPLVALAPFTFILAILQVFAWGLDLFTGLGVVISFLVLLSNFHAMFRYSERLYVDHYSGLMRVWAIFTDMLSFGAIILLLFFPPLDMNSKKIGIEVQQTKYSGDFMNGFEPSVGFDLGSVDFYEFYPEGHNAEVVKSNGISGFSSNVVLFIPDKRGDTVNYKPYLQLLAAEGYNVVSADFFARDCKWLHSIFDSKILRRTVLVTESLADGQRFGSQREFYTYNILLECKALYKMIKEKYGENCKIFLIGDGMADEAVADFSRKYPDDITGYFCLDFVHEYESAGYGCIAQTAPVLNSILGIPRERRFATPKLLVERSKEVIKF